MFIKQYAININNLLVAGDFNCIDSITDRSNGGLDKSSLEFSNFKTNDNLIDIWRNKHPTSREYTYINPSHNGHDSRIDYWLIPKPLINSTESCLITQPLRLTIGR